MLLGIIVTRLIQIFGEKKMGVCYYYRNKYGFMALMYDAIRPDLPLK